LTFWLLLEAVEAETVPAAAAAREDIEQTHR
jgi:hypothetical protein